MQLTKILPESQTCLTGAATFLGGQGQHIEHVMPGQVVALLKVCFLTFLALLIFTLWAYLSFLTTADLFSA